MALLPVYKGIKNPYIVLTKENYLIRKEHKLDLNIKRAYKKAKIDKKMYSIRYLGTIIPLNVAFDDIVDAIEDHNIAVDTQISELFLSPQVILEAQIANKENLQAYYKKKPEKLKAALNYMKNKHRNMYANNEQYRIAIKAQIYEHRKVHKEACALMEKIRYKMPKLKLSELLSELTKLVEIYPVKQVYLNNVLKRFLNYNTIQQFFIFYDFDKLLIRIDGTFFSIVQLVTKESNLPVDDDWVLERLVIERKSKCQSVL